MLTLEYRNIIAAFLKMKWLKQNHVVASYLDVAAHIFSLCDSADMQMQL